MKREPGQPNITMKSLASKHIYPEKNAQILHDIIEAQKTEGFHV